MRSKAEVVRKRWLSDTPPKVSMASGQMIIEFTDTFLRVGLVGDERKLDLTNDRLELPVVAICHSIETAFLLGFDQGVKYEKSK